MTPLKKKELPSHNPQNHNNPRPYKVAQLCEYLGDCAINV